MQVDGSLCQFFAATLSFVGSYLCARFTSYSLSHTNKAPNDLSGTSGLAEKSKATSFATLFETAGSAVDGAELALKYMQNAEARAFRPKLVVMLTLSSLFMECLL